MHKKVRFLPVFSVLFSFSAFLGFLPSAHAADPVKQTISQIAVDSNHILEMEISDTASVPNACDLSVERFEYIPALSLLTLHTLDQPCTLDVVGKRKTYFIWTLPMSLRSNGQELNVLLNDDVGGTFKIDATKSTLKRIR